MPLLRLLLLTALAALLWRLRRRAPLGLLQLASTLWLAELALTVWMSGPTPSAPPAERLVLPAFEGVITPRSWTSPPSDLPTVAFVGDSFTYGDGVGGDQAFPALIAAALPGAHVVNHGLPSQSFFDEVVTYAAITAPLDPDVVVWVWTLNDLGNPPFPPSLHPERDQPTPVGPWLIEIPRLAWWRYRLGAFMAEGYPKAMLHPARAALTEQMLQQLNDELDARGATLVLTAFPLLHQLDAYPFDPVHEHLQAVAARVGATWVDLVEPFRGRDATRLWARPDDHHPNAEAHRIAADALLTTLRPLAGTTSGPRDCDRLPVLPPLAEPTRRACRDANGRSLLDLAAAMGAMPVEQELFSPLGPDQIPLQLARVASDRDPALADEAAALIQDIKRRW
jgi:hypothetical protein